MLGAGEAGRTPSRRVIVVSPLLAPDRVWLAEKTAPPKVPDCTFLWRSPVADVSLMTLFLASTIDPARIWRASVTGTNARSPRAVAGRVSRSDEPFPDPGLMSANPLTGATLTVFPTTGAGGGAPRNVVNS